MHMFLKHKKDVARFIISYHFALIIGSLSLNWLLVLSIKLP